MPHLAAFPYKGKGIRGSFWIGAIEITATTWLTHTRVATKSVRIRNGAPSCLIKRRGQRRRDTGGVCKEDLGLPNDKSPAHGVHFLRPLESIVLIAESGRQNNANQAIYPSSLTKQGLDS